MTSTLQQFLFNNHRIEIFIPDSSAIKDNYKKGVADFTSPYWAKLWPSAIGLCQFLQNNLHYIKNKKVLELAAGLGLPGIFCATHASQVCISDIEPQAVALVQQSVLHNKLANITCRVIDWSDCEKVAIPDVLLLSDINYEPAQFEKLLSVIRYFLSNHCTIILSTPQRLMAKDFINQLLPYCKEQATTTADLDGQQTDISIFVLKE
jgi:predicted nicotinamide N-methyase